TRAMALEFGAYQIRVNAICPGLLWTREWETLVARMQARGARLAAMEPREIFLREVEAQIPLGREQTPEDVGHLVGFLCSDAGKNITGQAISVDGGMTLRGT
ncbi:MAG: SDR family oxidoreductase, partial [Dehalococcoidia bacterium]